MDKINFKNLPNKTTPVDAENLNQMQNNIESYIDGIVGDIENILSEV